jgi:hypothetical protein
LRLVYEALGELPVNLGRVLHSAIITNIRTVFTVRATFVLDAAHRTGAGRLDFKKESVSDSSRHCFTLMEGGEVEFNADVFLQHIEDLVHALAREAARVCSSDDIVEHGLIIAGAVEGLSERPQ